MSDECFLRELGRPGIDFDPQYILNGRQAMAHFADFLSERDEIGQDSLIAACASMHRVFSLGESGDAPYRRLDRPELLERTGRFTLDGLPPGAFRPESPKPVTSIRPSATEYADFVNRQVLRRDAPLAPGRILVPGIPPDLCPENRDIFYPQYQKTARVHYYPAARHLTAYFSAAAPVLQSARAAEPGSRDGLRTVAGYYFTMVNARPYAVLNNGLFMAQVNVLLILHGFPPVRHGRLDHLAHRFPFADFEYLFRQHLVGRLPTVASH